MVFMNMLEKIENPVPYQTIKDIVTWIEEDLTRAMPVIKLQRNQAILHGIYSASLKK
jgi:hypothetical protein